jgi:N-acyl-D-aspartate/D-glutamate deacylase
MPRAERASLGAAALVALVAGACVRAPSPTLDLVIAGGTLIDGTGAPGRRADVAIDDGIIVDVGDLGAVKAARVIDAAGLVVAPGFVDLHSHADLVLLADPATRDRLLEARLRQGITTLVVGNCGLGVAPASADAAAILSGVNAWMTPAGVAAGPLSIADYLARIERDAPLPLNVGTLVPHGPVRISAMGLAAGEPDEMELAAMRDAVEHGLDDGALGLSVGLIYPPGMYSATGELVELGRIVARHDALFTAHIRGSSETLLPATRELVEIARESGARVHHSHLEAVGREFWPSIPDVLAIEDAARREGLGVSHDVFPYHRAATMMTAIFPPWSLEGGVPALLERLDDPAAREAIRRDIAEHVPEWPPFGPHGWPHNLVQAVGWDGILVASVGPGGPADAVGRSLADLAAASGTDPFDFVAGLLVAEHGQVGQLVAEISGSDEAEAPLLEILAHPAAAVITDAEDYGRGKPHPANAGAFARALRLARERGAPPLEDLVRRMTGYPASLVRLADRGVIRPGAAADVVVLDAAIVADRATFDEPRLSPVGITHVLVNGAVVLDDGSWIGGRHGRVLRAGSPQSSSGTARLISSSSPSGVRASTSTMRRDAVPSP